MWKAEERLLNRQPICPEDWQTGSEFLFHHNVTATYFAAGERNNIADDLISTWIVPTQEDSV